MLSGVRQSVSGMTERAKAQEILANNLANINTTGFKADRMTFAQVLEQVAHPRRAGDTPLDASEEADAAPPAPRSTRPTADDEAGGVSRAKTGSVLTTRLRTAIDLRSGSIQPTGNDFDFALDGPGFFVVQTPEGERYTRGGSFTLNGQGQLVTREGYPVLSDGGPISAESGRIMVTGDGMVSAGGVALGKLRVAAFDGPRDLTRTSGGLYSSSVAPRSEDNIRVAQGYLEDANVNPVEMLTEMIDTMRGFESNQRALREQLDTMEKLVSEAGR